MVANAALPAELLLRHAGQHRAGEGEVRIDDRLRQIIGVGAHHAQRHIVLQYRQRRIGEQLGLARNRAGLADQIIRPPAHAGGRGISCPGETRRLGLDVGEGQLVVALVGVARFDAGPVDSGDALLELEDRIGTCGGIGRADEAEHRRDVRLILLARVGELGVVLQIIIAIRQAEPALPDVDDIGVGILAVLPDAHAEDAADAVACQLGHLDRKRRLVLRTGDLCEPRLDRRDAFRVGGPLVHEARVEIADLVARRFRRLIEDRAGLVVRHILQHVEHAPRRAVGGDLRALLPGSAQRRMRNRRRVLPCGPCPQRRSRTCRSWVWRLRCGLFRGTGFGLEGLASRRARPELAEASNETAISERRMYISFFGTIITACCSYMIRPVKPLVSALSCVRDCAICAPCAAARRSRRQNIRRLPSPPPARSAR